MGTPRSLIPTVPSHPLLIFIFYQQRLLYPRVQMRHPVRPSLVRPVPSTRRTPYYVRREIWCWIISVVVVQGMIPYRHHHHYRKLYYQTMMYGPRHRNWQSGPSGP